MIQWTLLVKSCWHNRINSFQQCLAPWSSCCCYENQGAVPIAPDSNMAASGRNHLPALGSSSVSGSVLQHQQHWDTGRSWTLAVWAGYTAGKVRFVPHRLSQVESHHPLWQTATLNSHCLCLTLSFLKSYSRSWGKGVRFERSENSVCKWLCIPPALLKLKGPCDYILCVHWNL